MSTGKIDSGLQNDGKKLHVDDLDLQLIIMLKSFLMHMLLMRIILLLILVDGRRPTLPPLPRMIISRIQPRTVKKRRRIKMR